MLSKRFLQLIRLFAIFSFSYLLISCGTGSGSGGLATVPCPSDGAVSFNADSYPESAPSAQISVADACIGKKTVVVNVDNGTDTIAVDVTVDAGSGAATIKFGATDDTSNTIAINEGDVLTAAYADANGVERYDTADITASIALSTLGVYSETNTNPELTVAEISNNAALTDRFNQAVTPLEGVYSLQADYALPASGNENGYAFTFYGLINPKFEANEASGGNFPCNDAASLNLCTGWTAFEFAFTNNTTGPSSGPVSHDAGGLQSLTMFGPFTFDSSTGAYQADNTVIAGESYTASAYVMNWAGDPLGADNLGIFQLTFWDAAGGQDGGGTQIGPAYELLVDSVDDGTNIYLPPQDGADISDWSELTITQTAPAGTVSAEMFLLHIQLNDPADPAAQAGSIFWDDISLAGVKNLSTAGEDISTYESLKFGINTTAASGLMDMEVKMEDNTGATASVFLSNYTATPGAVAGWDIYDIPLSDFAGLDKTTMISLGFYNASSTVTGSTSVAPTLLAATLYFDDVYFAKADAALTGILVDSPVDGVAFETVTQSGITNADGEFQYLDGETITFSIGDIVLGSVQGADIITSVELTGSVDPTAQPATNQLVFLQSIDEDENPANGITISAATQAAAVGQTLDFTLSSTAFTAAVTTVVAAIAPGNTVVSETTALNNFYLTYVQFGGTDTFSWLFPGYPPVPAVVSGANTTIDAAPASVVADGITSSTITVQAKDSNGNNFSTSAGTVLLSASGSAILSTVTDLNDGTYTATVTDTVAEDVTITGSIAGNNISDDATVTFTPGSVLDTLGVYSETNINPVLASQIINATDGNPVVTDETSKVVVPLDGIVSLQADFQNNSKTFGSFMFDFTTVSTLSNAGFETPDASGGDVTAAGAPWNSFNSNFTTSNLINNIPPGTFYSPDAHSGTQLLKQFGTDAGSFQDLPASPGETWEASAWAQSWAGDPNNNTGLMQIFFRDANDVNLCDPGGFNACNQAIFDTSQPVDTWVKLTASAVAPAGTTTVRIQLILVPDAGTPANGALFWDDASLTVANLLANDSFETPDASGGDVTGAGTPWNSFNSNFTTSNLRNNTPPGTFYSPDAHSGTQLLKQFGTDAGSFQDLPASPGETWEASAWAQSWAGDANNNTGLMQIFFRDATTNLCDPGGFAPCDQAVFDTSQPVDTWVKLTTSAVAPAGTTTVRIQLILVPDSGTPSNGALFWDDAGLSNTGTGSLTGGDIQGYEILKFGIDSTAMSGLADLKLQLEDGTVSPSVFLSDYTSTPNQGAGSNWDVYEIPLSDFAGLDKSNLTRLGFWNPSSVAGAESPLVFGPLYFDDIFFIKGIPVVPVLTGVLLDALVEGVTFKTVTQSGITNALGEFQYQAGELVTFSVGDIILGVVQGADIVTPVEITDSFDPTDQSATNLLVFLQSIDEDENYANGITISAATQAAAIGQTLDFNLSSAAFTAAVTTVVNAITEPDNTVVSETTALDNFYLTYVDLGGTDTFLWLFPGYPQVGEPGFELIWSDEFNVDGAPSTANWTLETGYGDNGWGNNEWQLYTTSPDNVRVESGALIITADCPTAPNCGVRDDSITSGRINTLNKFSFKYGKIKARIKPAVGLASAWPAFWMLGANFPNVGWPFSGEIDVMEMNNASSDEFTTHFTMHWCEDSIQAPASCSFPDGWVYDSQFRTFAESLGDDFHIFEAEWTDGQIIGKIDGITYFALAIDPVNMDEFLKEFFVILNVAMGGTLGSNGQPPSGAETWPQTMLVDYVRVYQLIGGDGTSTIGGGGVAGPNLLANDSFETPDASGGDVTGAGTPWNSFNSNFTSSNLFGPPVFFVNPDAHSGTQVLKQFGTDAGSFQDVAASPGETWEASAWAQSWAGDPNNNTGLMQIFFRDVNDVNLCDPGGFNACNQSVFDTSQPVDTWVNLTASAVAPAGTTVARIQLILVPDANTPAGGALFWDDASLSKFGSVSNTIGVFSETSTNPTLPFVQIIDAGVDFGGNSTQPNEFSMAVTPLDGNVELQALFLDSGNGFGGIIFNFGSAIFPPNPGPGEGQDISSYTTLKFGIDTSGMTSFADLKVQLEDGVVTPGVFLSNYTPTVSNNWKIYEIPLSDFTGLDLSNLTYLGFWNASSVAGAETPLVFGPLYFDDIHFKK